MLLSMKRAVGASPFALSLQRIAPLGRTRLSALFIAVSVAAFSVPVLAQSVHDTYDGAEPKWLYLNRAIANDHLSPSRISNGIEDLCVTAGALIRTWADRSKIGVKAEAPER
jgi:hypothetical protein